jgi:VWFA-related protein
MRRLLVLLALLLALPLFGQSPSAAYKIHFDPARDVTLLDANAAGTSGLFVQVRFSITVEGAAAEDPSTQYKILVEENGHKVHEDDVPRPTPSDDLAVVLAMDTSGSMKKHGRMEKARHAAEVFVKRLPARAECGLILFDHEIRTELTPATDRQPLLKAVAVAQPRGGTAFLDAVSRGIKMLADAPPLKKRYIVLMTDGVDLNSAAVLAQVIDEANRNKVHVVTIGIGEPGRQEKVSTVLVLDKSGSMDEPARAGDRTRKITALHKAAARFIEVMPTTGAASLLPFSDSPEPASEFSNNRALLIQQVQALRAGGYTAFLDATYAAIGKLDASGRPGKRAVIAMTDGDDNVSQRDAKDVVLRAMKAKIPIYTLGFGREDQVNTKLLRMLADETGGNSYHARDEKSLIEIFEDLSIQLHDDGIDEIALTQLADQTGGQYFPVKDIGELRLILEKVTDTIQQKQYEITFPSLIQRRDGTHRLVNMKLVRRTGELVSNTAGGMVVFGGDQVLETKASSYQTRGLVVAEMHPLVYLILLGGIGLLLILPGYLRASPARRKARGF